MARHLCERLPAAILAVVDAVRGLETRVSALEGRPAPRHTTDGVRLDVQGRTLAQLERAALIAALKQAGGVQSRAAKLLGISARVMQYKVQALGLQEYCCLILDRTKGRTS